MGTTTTSLSEALEATEPKGQPLKVDGILSRLKEHPDYDGIVEIMNDEDGCNHARAARILGAVSGEDVSDRAVRSWRQRTS